MIVKVVIPDSIYARVYFARGEQGPQGPTGPTGLQGPSGVVNVDSPITNSGTSTAANIGINQALLSITPSQVTGTAVITTDPRLSDTRIPTDASVTDSKIIGTGLSPNKITGTAVITTDSRLSDARTPLAHAASHGSAGSDPVTLAQSQITNLVSDLSAKAPSASPTFTGTVTTPVTSGTLLWTDSSGVLGKVGNAPGLGYVPYTGAVTGGIAWQNLATLAKTDSTNTFTFNQQINAGLLIGTQVTGTTAASGQLRTSSDTGSNYIDTTANSSANVGPGYTGRRARGSVASPSQVQANDLLFGIFANGWNDAGAFSGNSVAFRMIANQNFTTTGIGSAMVWETATDNTTGRAERMRITGSGTLSIGTTGVAGQLGVVSADAARQGLIVRGAASQSANLQEWQNSAGSVLASISATGSLVADRVNVGGASFGSGVYYGRINVLQESGGHAIGIQGRDSQSVDLLRLRLGSSSTGSFIQMQNSGGTTTASIDSSGNVRGLSVRTNSDYTSLLEANSGGYVRMTRQTAATPNPGANLGSLYFRDGTNAGTLKLVVRAGAAGAETTILDNIPT